MIKIWGFFLTSSLSLLLCQILPPSLGDPRYVGADPDPHLWLTDPDPDPTPFFSDFKDNLPAGTFSSILQSTALKINFVLKLYFASIISVRLTPLWEKEKDLDPDPYLWQTFPEGPKTWGSGIPNTDLCSATAPISYPASLSKLPNGCQSHPRFYPSPPDRSPITKPDSNYVLRAATFIQLLAWVDIKMHKAVEAWKQKRVHINNMYKLHIFI